MTWALHCAPNPHTPVSCAVPPHGHDRGEPRLRGPRPARVRHRPARQALPQRRTRGPRAGVGGGAASRRRPHHSHRRPLGHLQQRDGREDRERVPGVTGRERSHAVSDGEGGGGSRFL